MKIFTITLLLAAAFLNAGVISLTDAKNSALEKNYSYAISKEDLTKSQLSVKSAMTGFLPQASLKSNYLIYTPEVKNLTGTMEDRTAFSFTVSQPLFTGGKLWYNYQISKESEKIQSNKLTSEMISLVNQVESAYINLLEKKELLTISKEALELARRNEESAVIKQQSGLSSNADRLKSSSARAASEVDLISSEKSYELAKISFTNLTGLNGFELQGIGQEHYLVFMEKLKSLQYADIQKIQEKFVQVSAANNIDLKNTGISKHINEHKITLAKGSFLPSVNLSYSTEWAKNNLDQDYKNNGTVALSASIPVFPLYDNYLELEKSRIELKKSELTEKQLSDNIGSQISSAIYSLVLNTRQFYSSQIAAELALDTYNNVEERANSDISTEEELINARIALVKAKYGVTTAYYSILRSKSELLKIIGSENEDDVINLF